MQTQSGTFDQHRIKRLNGEAVQCGSAVEHDGVTFGHFSKNIPNHGFAAIDHLLGTADGMSIAAILEVMDDEGFKEDHSHLLGQTALMDLEFGSDHDDGTSGVVHTFTEQVLTETALFAFEHIGKGLERTVSGTGDGAAVTAVVEQSVNSFLKHTLFVADNDFGGVELQQAFQTAVAVDDTTIEVVEVTGGKAAAIQRNQRTEIRGDHRQNSHNHPFRTGIAGHEAFHETDALGKFLADRFIVGAVKHSGKIAVHGGQINAFQQRLESGSTHFSGEAIAVVFASLVIFQFGKGLTFDQRSITRIGNDVEFVVNHIFEVLGRHIEHQTDTAGSTLEEPDVSHRHGQFDMAHALTAHFCLSNFDAAAVTDDAFVLDAFVLSAVTFPVPGGTENAFAEKTALFGFEGTIVDGFRILDFTE